MRREGQPEGQQDWLEAIAEKYPDEAWVQRAAFPDGRVEFTDEPWHGLYWDAWGALRYDRHYGAMGGQGPIPYAVIRAYAQDHGIMGLDLFIFRTFMSVLDAEWLNYSSDKEQGKNGRRSQT